MVNNFTYKLLRITIFVLLSYTLILPCLATIPRKLALVQPQPLILKYHNGPLLKGNLTVNLIWYGKFSPIQRSIIVDFITSLSSKNVETSKPSVSSWWEIIGRYRGGPCSITLGKQVFDEGYSLGKILTSSKLVVLSSRLAHKGAINVVLTSDDVASEDFCMNTCGSHGYNYAGRHKKVRVPYAWVGNPGKQCPGQCAWPFHQPMFGPQLPPLVAPNGDVGVDGMVINLATVLAGAVTNPFNSGYFQGPAEGALEAVSACTGIFGSGSFPGFPGKVLIDPYTKASFNAYGLYGRKYLLPAIWDPKTFSCKTLL
ncbi:protein EXORDIUM-like 2 [Silene latifolia]|uniref:protein EXORDIUM-like 2 n=1 Tax=Silene latifolia TaxID=37657 RepID=UPI003D76CE49